MRVSLMLSMLVLVVAPAYAQSGSGYSIMQDDYSIMVPEKGARPSKPEPWLAPKYKSPRGTVKRVTIPKSTIVQPPSAAVPPPTAACQLHG